jgi:MFS family permease
MMTLSQFLAGLAGGSLAAAALSYLSERFPPFQKLEPQIKWWVQLVGTVLLAVAAYAVSVFVSVDTLNAMAPWFAVVVQAVVAFKVNQATHRADVKQLP